MRKVLDVALREFRHTVLTKAFLIAAVIFPTVMWGSMFALQAMLHAPTPPLEGAIAVVDPSGNVADNSVSATADQSSSSWQVALGGQALVGQIVLSNVNDDSFGNLSNFRVSLIRNGIEVFGQNYFPGSGTVARGGSLTVNLPANSTGDTVKVLLLGKNNQNNGILSLAEVQVFGQLTATVNLAGVANAQTLGLTLPNLSSGTSTVSVTLRIKFLLGDTNGDGVVNSGDTTQTRNRSGQATDVTNFRSDVNADGFINSGDTTAVRSRSGTFLP